ncbi:uncharacterized protein METZ01_LOCUS422095 [marine metagenome]|uniref:Uncharacterized protein n=1 Tax=marine metagenome TaxID=408172 RepID=A0A382XFS3_9ZZZZ
MINSKIGGLCACDSFPAMSARRFDLL